MHKAITLTLEKKDKREPLKFMPLPDYGDHMTVIEFEKGCYTTAYTDSDGVGYYATKEQLTNITVRPSDFIYAVEHPYTHVMWFNK